MGAPLFLEEGTERRESEAMPLWWNPGVVTAGETADLSSGVSALEGLGVFLDDHAIQEALIGPRGNLCVVKWCPGRSREGQRRRATRTSSAP